MRVRDFMVPAEKVIKADRTATLQDVGKLIVDHRIGSVIIMDKNDPNPVGILVQKDIVRAFVNGAQLSDSADKWMSKNLIYVLDTLHTDPCSQAMIDAKVHHLLVKNDKGNWVGLTTSYDLVMEAALNAKAFPFNRSAFKYL